MEGWTYLKNGLCIQGMEQSWIKFNLFTMSLLGLEMRQTTQQGFRLWMWPTFSGDLVKSDISLISTLPGLVTFVKAAHTTDPYHFSMPFCCRSVAEWSGMVRVALLGDRKMSLLVRTLLLVVAFIVIASIWHHDRYLTVPAVPTSTVPLRGNMDCEYDSFPSLHSRIVDFIFSVAN